MSAARPILFSAPMIQALLAGRKTQTRRIVKDAPIERGGYLCTALVTYRDEAQLKHVMPQLCPYGAPSGLLWVRETWGVLHDCYLSDADEPTFWRADYQQTDLVVSRWRPSIHMPRSRSRLTLRITDVRVERLMEISAADAEAEGWPHAATGGVDVPLRDAYPIGWYANLWNDINGAGAWEINPYVWALTFEVIKQNVDQVLQAKAAA